MDREQQILSLIPRVRKIAYCFAPPFDDRVQDGTVGAIQAVDSWNGEGSLGGWASFRIRGAILDGLRVERGRTYRPQLVPLDGHDAAAPGLDLDGQVDVRRAVRRLPARERATVYAYYWQGRELAQIGAGQGVTEARICQVLGRARSRMRADCA